MILLKTKRWFQRKNTFLRIPLQKVRKIFLHILLFQNILSTFFIFVNFLAAGVTPSSPHLSWRVRLECKFFFSCSQTKCKTLKFKCTKLFCKVTPLSLSGSLFDYFICMPKKEWFSYIYLHINCVFSFFYIWGYTWKVASL